jgi:hypothetical protein
MLLIADLSILTGLPLIADGTFLISRSWAMRCCARTPEHAKHGSRSNVIAAIRFTYQRLHSLVGLSSASRGVALNLS